MLSPFAPLCLLLGNNLVTRGDEHGKINAIAVESHGYMILCQVLSTFIPSVILTELILSVFLCSSNLSVGQPQIWLHLFWLSIDSSIKNSILCGNVFSFLEGYKYRPVDQGLWPELHQSDSSWSFAFLWEWCKNKNIKMYLSHWWFLDKTTKQFCPWSQPVSDLFFSISAYTSKKKKFFCFKPILISEPWNKKIPPIRICTCSWPHR